MLNSRAESFFGGKVDVLVNNAGVSPVLPFDTVMKVYNAMYTMRVYNVKYVFS